MSRVRRRWKEWTDEGPAAQSDETAVHWPIGHQPDPTVEAPETPGRRWDSAEGAAHFERARKRGLARQAERRRAASR